MYRSFLLSSRYKVFFMIYTLKKTHKPKEYQTVFSIVSRLSENRFNHPERDDQGVTSLNPIF